MADQVEWEQIESLMGELVEEGQAKLLELGRHIVPTLTPEDVLQPNDYPELENNPLFRYEEGVLAGLQSARIALRALRKMGCHDDLWEKNSQRE